MIQLRFIQRHGQPKILQQRESEEAPWEDVPLHLETEEERHARMFAEQESFKGLSPGMIVYGTPEELKSIIRRQLRERGAE